MAQRYETYKDSGVQWLGEIPGHWERTKVANLFKQIGSGTTPSSGDTSLYADKGTPWLQSGDFNNNEIHHTSKYITNKALDNYSLKLYKPGGIVIAMYGASIGKVGLLNIATTVNQACCVLSDNDYLLQKYAFYVFINEKENLIKKSKGGTQPNISQEIIKSHYIPLPPLSEQHSIVSYLDNKCGKIDEWLDKKQKEVEHLQELKQRIIADAVTRGLNPDVKMKATNIPWLPEVPEHWECVKLKAFCKDNKEKNKGNIEACVLSLSYGNVIVKQNINFGLVPENYESYQIVYPGYIILRLTDLQNDHKSLRTGLVKHRGIITSAYVGLVVSNMNSTYVQLLLHSYDVMKVFYGMGGGLRQSMSYQDISNLYIPVPPLSEQAKIVTYITNKTSKIDTLIANINKEIENIKEYKQRLISDVVTGQRKVC